MTQVLIVDDRAENLYFLRALLQGHGYDVQEAHHGAEALLKARAQPPQLVISDLLMPVMDGYTLLRQWRADERLKGIPFIVYTATYTEPKDEQLALDLGADAFILKPAEPQPFMAQLREVLARERAGTLTPAAVPAGDEEILLRQYNEVLVRKLEEKAFALEASNRALKDDVARRQGSERDMQRLLVEATQARAALLGILEDQQQAEVALRESEQRFRLAASGGDVWSWNIESNAIEFPPEFWRRLGWDVPAVADTVALFESLLAPEDVARWRLAVNDHLSQRLPYDFQFRARSKTGDSRWFHSRGQAMWDADGRAIRMAGTTFDISERKQVEAREQALQQRLAVTLESITDSFFSLDRQWRFTYLTTRAAKTLNWEPQALLGRNIWEVFPQFVGQPFYDAYHRAMEQQCAVEIEDYYAPQQRWFENRIYPAPDGLSVFVLEITARKRAQEALQQSQQRLNFALERSHTGAWEIDLVDHSTYHNLEHDRIYGYEALLPQWTYKMFFEHVVAEDRAEVDRLFRTATAAQTDWSFECRIRRADGEVRWILAVGGYQHEGAGPARRMAGIVQDVTARKLAEEGIRTLNRELEQRVLQRTAQLEAANRELEAFSYSASHDLRAPLRAIQGFAAIIARRHKDALKEEARHYFDNIIVATERMERLIDDLLKYSRVGRGGLSLQPVSLAQVLADVTRLLAQRLAQTGATLTVADDLPVVIGDAGLLRQIFTNLLDNALSYRRKDEALRVEVTWRQEQGACVVRVADNGIGIAPGHLEKIFQMFERLHSDEDYPGTGIGLALVRKAAELMGGAVWAQSSGFAGSSFFVKLPPQEPCGEHA